MDSPGVDRTAHRPSFGATGVACVGLGPNLGLSFLNPFFILSKAPHPPSPPPLARAGKGQPAKRRVVTKKTEQHSTDKGTLSLCSGKNEIMVNLGEPPRAFGTRPASCLDLFRK